MLHGESVKEKLVLSVYKFIIAVVYACQYFLGGSPEKVSETIHFNIYYVGIGGLNSHVIGLPALD